MSAQSSSVEKAAAGKAAAEKAAAGKAAAEKAAAGKAAAGKAAAEKAAAQTAAAPAKKAAAAAPVKKAVAVKKPASPKQAPKQGSRSGRARAGKQTTSDAQLAMPSNAFNAADKERSALAHRKEEKRGRNFKEAEDVWRKQKMSAQSSSVEKAAAGKAAAEKAAAESFAKAAAQKAAEAARAKARAAAAKLEQVGAFLPRGGRVRVRPERGDFVDPTTPGLSFATPAGGVKRGGTLADARLATASDK
jgi:hypothetical protein